MSVPPSVEARAKATGTPVPGMPFAPHFALRDLFGWTVALALLAGLSAFLPWELGRKADLFASAPAGIRPEWYFLWMFQALKYAPATILGVSGEFWCWCRSASAPSRWSSCRFSTVTRRARGSSSNGWRHVALVFMAVMTAPRAARGRRMTAHRALFLLAGLMLRARPRARPPAGPADPQDLFRDDVHAKAGLSCVSCHAGAPPYGPIERTKIAQLCARCHSDADYMKKYNPQLRVDQYQQYLTSTHGKKMSTGETRVATCTDCHGAHGIRAVSDARSPVAPQNVATTCARCHADHARMAAFGHEDSPPEDWKASVHAAALLKRGDTSAPTCTPVTAATARRRPASTSVAFVCSQCHVREAELFRKSPKKAIFDVIAQGECLTCHSNHRIEKPSDTFIGLQDPALCARCHNDELKGADLIRSMQKGLRDLGAGIERATEQDATERSKMTEDGLFRDLEVSRFRTIIEVLFSTILELCDFHRVGMRLVHGTRPAPITRGIPAKSLRAAPTVNPALVNNARTAASWPAPNSTNSRPPDAKRRRASDAMAP